MKFALKMAFILTCFCVWAGGTLSWVENFTRDKIRENEKKKQELLRTKVLTARQFKPREKGIFLGFQEDEVVGVVIPSSIKGYAGEIKMLVGVGKDRKIKGLEILSHQETPGLGAEITKDWFKNQFKEKTIEELFLKKDRPQEGKIEAITAATISSRAVTEGLKIAVEKATRLFLELSQE
jgi:electron transport complex protein RnfG